MARYPESPEVHSENYPTLPKPIEVTDLASLRYADPGVFDAVNTVLATLKNDMLPEVIQMQIVEAMSPNTRRDIVSKIAGLDASVLFTFKQQVALVDAVLRRVVNADGTANPSGRDLDITVKDAINMSLKVVGMLTKDLPKVYNIARVQRMERALTKVVESKLSKSQQAEVLKELERLELAETESFR